MKIYTVGGYSDVEGNMTAVEVNNEIIIIDMGISMPQWVSLEEEQRKTMGENELKALGVLPRDEVIPKNKVKAIVISHAHMDHFYGVYWLAEKYNAPLIMTPFVYEVMMRDEDFADRVKNKIIQLNPGSFYKVGNFEIEFIYSTHSTPQTVMVALHTKEGTVLYANDWKFDYSPTLGKKTNIKRLKELKNQVKVMIMDCLRSDEYTRTPSESVVRETMKDLVKRFADDDGVIFATTFSSHIARIKWLTELAEKIGRRPMIIGRSMKKYVKAAEAINIASFEGIKVFFGKDKIKRAMKKVSKNRKDYFLIVTGGQGERGSFLVGLANNVFPFEFNGYDTVVFLNRVIPNPINQAQRALLERQLREKKARILRDIHASGHASREDQRDLIRMIRPEYIIPAHAGPTKQAYLVELAMEEGYEVGKNVFITQNGRIIEL